MNIIFLDFDGVVNDHGQMMNLYCGIQPDKVVLLNKIIDATDCKIVISSAWRYMIIGGEMTLKGFEIMMLTHGIKCHNRIIGHTPSDEEFPTRGQQITVSLNDIASKEDYIRYVVVDDLDKEESIQITEEGHLLVKTDGNVGLTELDADKIISYLRG